jgi:phosphopantetheinyl transferase (holo-ACP synthase)
MLGKNVAIDQLLTLTSGQQARAAGWLAERGFAPAQLRKQLSTPFTAAGVLGGAAAPEDQPGADGPRQHRPTPVAAQNVGIDIQLVDEVIPVEADADLKSSAEITSIFTLREISYAQSRPSPRETLCGLFCAKEALRKCDATLLSQRLTQIEVLPDEDGKPCFEGYSLSVSHSGGFAIAVALSNAPLTAVAPAPAPAAVVGQPVVAPQPATPPHQANARQRGGETSRNVQMDEQLGVSSSLGQQLNARPRAGTHFEHLFRRFILGPARLWRSRAMH